MAKFEIVYVYVKIGDFNEKYECVGETFKEAYAKAYEKLKEFLPGLRSEDTLAITNIYDDGCHGGDFG